MKSKPSTATLDRAALTAISHAGLLACYTCGTWQDVDAADLYREILETARRAQLADFRPLMFVIPVHPIAHLFTSVGIKRRANLLSEEYIIRKLPRNFFDAVEV